MRFFILHGSFGSPDDNWFPWLKAKLENFGHEVLAPRMPVEDEESFTAAVVTDPSTPATNQNLTNWLKAFEPYLKQADSETVFIGHSLAPAFILHLLQKINTPVKACFFVSPFLCLGAGGAYDAVNKSFVETSVDWDKITSHCNAFYLFWGNNDPYVSRQDFETFQKALQAAATKRGIPVKVIIIPQGGHLNAEFGYREFQLLLEKIEDVLPKRNSPSAVSR